MDQLTDRQIKDAGILLYFVQLYCQAKHGRSPAGKTAVEAPPSGNPGKKAVYLCGDCAALVNYAMDKRRKCPLDPKPSCKHCPIHCYGKAYRTKMREVMAFSGKRLILRGRLDLLWHYFF